MTLDEVVVQLGQSDAALRETIAPLSLEQWSWKPDADTWSIGEGAEHLFLVERGILFRLHTASGDGIEQTDGKEHLMAKLVERTNKFPAPARVVPGGKFASQTEFLHEISAARAATLAWAQDPGTDLRKHVMPHPAFGELHGLQWLLMISTHTLRHIGQMREVMAAGGYSR